MSTKNNPFDQILVKGVRSGHIPARTAQARVWYRDTAKRYNSLSERSLLKDDSRITTKPYVGSMYLFHYDAKHKQTLPYWDRMPLIFPFEMVEGGFKGINVHYLPLPLRAKLMDALYDIRSDDRYDQATRLKLSYDVLKGSSKFRWFKPCVKHYLTDHVRSRFLYISPSEWDIALFLPLERFQKSSKEHVWKDSKMRVVQGMTGG